MRVRGLIWRGLIFGIGGLGLLGLFVAELVAAICMGVRRVVSVD